jgi:hypothetical protein
MLVIIVNRRRRPSLANFLTLVLNLTYPRFALAAYIVRNLD